MKTLIAIVLALTALCAQAKDIAVYRADAGVIMLTDSKCEKFPKALAGRFTYNEGKSIGLCWVEKDNVIYIIDDDGDQGAIPSNEFKPVINT